MFGMLATIEGYHDIQLKFRIETCLIANSHACEKGNCKIKYDLMKCIQIFASYPWTMFQGQNPAGVNSQTFSWLILFSRELFPDMEQKVNS